jgi:uridine phosphorylase
MRRFVPRLVLVLLLGATAVWLAFNRDEVDPAVLDAWIQKFGIWAPALAVLAAVLLPSIVYRMRTPRRVAGTPWEGPRLNDRCTPGHVADMSAAPPILSHKHYAAPSAFAPENLLREARRQKRLADAEVPAVCVLDPDGDIVRRLKREARARPDPGWACYHTELYRFDEGGIEFGIVGCVVGASFAVLVAEELFASGCRFLVSVTSAGQLARLRPPPYFVLIDRALRDEGTSYHYLPPAEFSHADAGLLGAMSEAFVGLSVPVERGATWTTDAPFRETAEAIAAMQQKHLLAVEMEAAALYALAQARSKSVLCFAHVTNQMARSEGDFEKGEAEGTVDALALIRAAAQAWMRSSV